MATITARYGKQIVAEHIESYDYPPGTRPFYEVEMTSGAKYLVSKSELGKVFPEVLR